MKLLYVIQSFVLVSTVVCNINGMGEAQLFHPTDAAIALEQKAARVLKDATTTVLLQAQGVLKVAEAADDGKEIDKAVVGAHQTVINTLTGLPADKQHEIRDLWTGKFYNPIREYAGDIPAQRIFIQERFDELQSCIQVCHLVWLVTALRKYTPVTVMVGDPNEEGDGDDGEDEDEQGDATMA